MPTYDYRCESCGDTFEHFQAISSPLLRKCKKCGKKSLKRLISAAGLLFKGSGFYITDYRNSSYHDAAKKDAAPTSSDSKTDAGKDAAPSGSADATKKPADPATPAPAKKAAEPASKSSSPKTSSQKSNSQKTNSSKGDRKS